MRTRRPLRTGKEVRVPGEGTAHTKLLWCLSGSALKASSRVRGHQMAAALAPLGFDSRLVEGRGRRGAVHVAAQLPRADVLILQKTVSRHHLRLAQLAKSLGRTVVFDIDDYPAPDESAETIHNFNRLCEISDVVFAGCDALIELARQAGGRAIFVPTTVARQEPVTPADGPFHVGWVGSPRYGAEMAALLKGPLETLAAERPLRLTVLGARAPSLEGIENLSINAVRTLDWAAPDAVREALDGVDVGVYPLADSLFNRHKCAYKALQYMALGLPTVASPVGTLPAVVRDGIDGFVADDFTAALKILADNPGLRARMGERGRERARTHYAPERAAETIANTLRLVKRPVAGQAPAKPADMAFGGRP